MPEELSREFGVEVTPRTLLVTYHPVTLEYESTEEEFAELLAALEASGRPAIFTYPNADTRGRALIRMIDGYVRAHPEARVRENFGTRAYLGLMANAAAMVGNSSSGIIEAASFRLPVVDVGMRQRGRARVHNVLTVDGKRAAIAAAIERATSAAFRAGLAGLRNPYGDGRAAERIVERLATQPLDRALIEKSFYRPGMPQ